MQITEITFDWIKTKIAPDEPLTFDDLYDPEVNIRFGSYFISYCLQRYDDDLATAAAAYHSEVQARGINMGNVQVEALGHAALADGSCQHALAAIDQVDFIPCVQCHAGHKGLVASLLEQLLAIRLCAKSNGRIRAVQ